MGPPCRHVRHRIDDRRALFAELLPLLPQFWISGLAILPFILVAHGGSYLFMRRLGGYRRLDAYFASLPGGIVDSAVLAEQAGADLRIVTVQHFIRIILVVVSVPLLFLFVQGDVVGSLAGETIATATYDNVDVLLILAIAMIGLAVGRWTGLPVSHMMVPLLFSLVHCRSPARSTSISLNGWRIWRSS